MEIKYCLMNNKMKLKLMKKVIKFKKLLRVIF